MNRILTTIGPALALLAALSVAGCADRPTQQAEVWSGQYDTCYHAAFPKASPPAAADRQDTQTLEHCLAARGWTASS